MKTWQKVGIGVVAAGLLGGMVLYSVKKANQGVVTVQTGTVGRQDLTSIVTASGEIKPLTYSNVLGEGIGKITDFAVKEGDKVKRGAVLLHVESIQPAADVQAQQAAITSSEAGVQSAEANSKSAQAILVQRQADEEHAKLDFDRGVGLFKDGLIPKSDYDTRKATYDSAVAAVVAAQATIAQMKAQIQLGRANLEQNRAMLNHTRDILRKTTYTAPIDGVVTYIAVRVGETVVPGIQNSAGSYLMTISDMAVVTTELKVDETDIVNIQMGQLCDVVIDAVPGKTYQGHVTEVGTQAILRTSGLASTQTTTGSQEAKDFKVVVTLDHPPDNLRPGLSATAKIRTAEKKNIVAIPLQAVAIRTRKELDDAEKQRQNPGSSGVTHASNSTTAPAATSTSSAKKEKDKEEIQGVFVINNGKAEFRQVETGIVGTSDIEIIKGIKEGDIIVTGSYKTLRTMRPNSTVKVDNSAPKSADDQKS
jgi:HlyD family secretion protein